VIANQDFGFTPQQTLDMGWSLLQNMFEEYNSMMSKDNNEESSSISELSKIKGLKINRR